MIFVAVTMGFFAESIRENISSNEKEHAYRKLDQQPGRGYLEA